MSEASITHLPQELGATYDSTDIVVPPINGAEISLTGLKNVEQNINNTNSVKSIVDMGRDYDSQTIPDDIGLSTSSEVPSNANGRHTAGRLAEKHFLPAGEILQAHEVPPTVSEPSLTWAQVKGERDQPMANSTTIENAANRPSQSEILQIPIPDVPRTEVDLDQEYLTKAQSGVVPMTLNDQAEFEVDASPIASSSEDSSEDSDDDYEMLDPIEQAQRLMQEDGGSDDEGSKKVAKNNPLRTLNEQPDEIVEIPDITVSEDIKIEELGSVETIVGNIVLIKAKTSGEYQVLEAGSLLCLDNRTVLGVVAETLGRVQQPFYSLRFTKASDISESGVSENTKIFYVPLHSTYVFTQALKINKGSDASNIHDEEVGDDELEFSDDEAEADSKRKSKMQKQARRDVRAVRTSMTSTISRGPPRVHELRKTGDAELIPDSGPEHISYDDHVDDEELYTPLARPAFCPDVIKQGERGTRGQGDRGRRGDHRRGKRGRGYHGGDRGFTFSRAPMQTAQQKPGLSLPATPTFDGFTTQMLTGPAQRLRPPTAAPSYFSSHEQQNAPPQQNFSANQTTSEGYFDHPHAHTPVSHSYPHQQLPMTYSTMCYNQYLQPQHWPDTVPSPQATNPILPPGAYVNPAFIANHHQQAPSVRNFAAQYPEQPPSHVNDYNSRRL